MSNDATIERYKLLGHAAAVAKALAELHNEQLADTIASELAGRVGGPATAKAFAVKLTGYKLHGGNFPTAPTTCTGPDYRWVDQVTSEIADKLKPRYGKRP